MQRVRGRRGVRAKLVVAAIALAFVCLGGCLVVSCGGRHAARNIVLPRVAERLGAELRWGEIRSTLGAISVDDLQLTVPEIPEAEVEIRQLRVSYRLWPLLLGRVEIGRIVADTPTVRFTKIDRSTISRVRAHYDRVTRSGERNDDGVELSRSRSPEMSVVDGAVSARGVAGTRVEVSGIEINVAEQGRFEIQAASTAITTAEGARPVAALGAVFVTGIRDPSLGIDIDEVSIEGAQARWVLGAETNDLASAVSEYRALVAGVTQTTEAAGEGGASTSRLPRVQPPPSIHLTKCRADFVVHRDARGRSRTLQLTDVEGQLFLGTDREPPSIDLQGQLEPGQGRFEVTVSFDEEGHPGARARLTELHVGQLASGLSVSGLAVDQRSLLDADVTVDRTMEGSLRFRGEIAADGVTVSSPLIAARPLTGVRVRAIAGGEYRHDEGTLSLDDARLFLNGIETRLSGHVARHAGRTVIDATADLSPVRCADVLEATPMALRDRLSGMVLTGLISGRAHFALDTEHVEELELDVVFQNGCEGSGTGQLSTERLAGAFLHRVQLPEEEVYEFWTGPGSGSWASMEQISPFMIAAVLSTEDGGFYHHTGFNLREIRSALIRDIQAERPRFGASTITMQLARNLYLNRERTLARKIQEAVLTWYLESNLSKDEILTYYLNVIEYGPRVFGIRHAAMYYFGRQPDDLSPREAVFLAKLLPSPVRRHDDTYGEGELPPRWQVMIDRVLTVMRERDLITQAEHAAALEERIVFFREGDPLPLHRTWRFRAHSYESWEDGSDDTAADRWLEIDTEAEIPAPADLIDDFEGE